MNLGEKIKTLRKKSNLSQEQLAEKLNVSRQAVSKWESNTAYPDISNLILLREIFGVTLDYLVIDNDTTERECINEDINSFDNTKLYNIENKSNTYESSKSSDDKKWYNIKLKTKKINYEEDKEEDEDSIEEEDDHESNLMFGGFAIGTAIGFITGNFLWGTAGSFIGLGIGYILKNIKINNN